jgi:uncharacterized GH25 family protein
MTRIRRPEYPVIDLRKIIVFLFTFLPLLPGPGSSLLAHDFWIEPSTFQPSVGHRVDLTLRVGQDFSGDSQPYITNWFSDYRAVGPDAEYPIEAVIGEDPAGSIVPRSAGVHIIGYRSTQNFVEMEPVKFEKYLADEGLEAFRNERARDGQSGLPGREYYSRCAKSLIEAGDSGPTGNFDKPLNYTLELIPERDPYSLIPGDRLPVRLLYESKPLQGALVIAFTSDQPEKKLRQRTDADGRVTMLLPHSGVWLFKAVHMIRVPKSDTQADWESFWASMTFRLPPPN